MSDFVTRLEAELRQAALRQDRAASMPGVALPRVRAFGGLAATAAAVLVIAVVLAGVAAVFLGSEPERGAGGDVPAQLRGAWRLAASVERRVEPAPVQLRLYPKGSERCTRLRAGSKACYAIDNAQGGALEWGTLSTTGNQITFRAKVRAHCRPSPCRDVGTPGVYLWGLEEGTLHLTMLRDELGARPATLTSGPLRRASEPPKTKVPSGWTASRFTSNRYGYSIRYPSGWGARAAASPMPPDGLAADTSTTVDKLAHNARGAAGPMVLIAASEIPEGTAFGQWSAQLQSRVDQSGACASAGGGSPSVDGEPAIVTIYPRCNGKHQQWAAFVHGGRGYQISWWGEPRREDADAPLFREILRTFEFQD
jgi:hypothetical protein